MKYLWIKFALMEKEIIYVQEISALFFINHDFGVSIDIIGSG